MENCLYRNYWPLTSVLPGGSTSLRNIHTGIKAHSVKGGKDGRYHIQNKWPGGVLRNRKMNISSGWKETSFVYYKGYNASTREGDLFPRRGRQRKRGMTKRTTLKEIKEACGSRWRLNLEEDSSSKGKRTKRRREKKQLLRFLILRKLFLQTQTA